jgi:hypothetical protein
MGKPYRRWFFLSTLSHEDVCQLMRQEFGLPEFKFDCEIEHNWGIAVKDGIEVNVSYDTRSRRERVDDQLMGEPDNNFTIIFTQIDDPINVGHHWFLDKSISETSKRLADLLNVEMHYLIEQKSDEKLRFLRFSPRIKRD